MDSENEKLLWKTFDGMIVFKEIREKIWRFYRITVCRYLSDNQENYGSRFYVDQCILKLNVGAVQTPPAQTIQASCPQIN